MPILIVKYGDAKRRIPFWSGRSLRDILDETDARVRSGCRGAGACGLCRVRLEEGEVGEPTQNEYLHLEKDQLADGIRLACQVMPEQDLQIEIIDPPPKSNWRSLPSERQCFNQQFLLDRLTDLPAEVEKPCGVAVDLGTTHISLSLYELSSGQWLAGRYGTNPQMDFGADIMTRLIAASEFSDQARAMSRQVVSAINEALFDIATREGIDLSRVVSLFLVGNTAMLALLSKRNYDLLLLPDNWVSPIDCLPEDTNPWAAFWGIYPRANIEVLPPLAGFVGSDLLAGVLTTGLTEKAGSLLIDFGTNSEVALWDGQRLWVTSAAGGPAFEGSGISCGMPAMPGAVYRVGLKDGAFDFAVIAGGEPRGVCGSGLVDIISNLVKSGFLDKMGRFAPSVPKAGFAMIPDGHIVLTKGDVDVFQRAKAAIGSGIRVLMDRAGIKHAELQRVCVCGAFGRFLNVTNARNIGLLPKIQTDLVELCGNTALAGCADVLLSSVAGERLKNLRDNAKMINLSRCPEFDDIFLENLYLKPL